jgi:hypothetical protein
MTDMFSLFLLELHQSSPERTSDEYPDPAESRAFIEIIYDPGATPL